MSVLLSACGVALAVVAAGFLLLFRKLASQQGMDQLPRELFMQPPAAKYKPMERLLNEGDFQLVASYPTLSPSVGRRLRVERRRIFRAYLRSLRRDFGRIYTACRILILYSEADRPDLTMALLKLRAQFAWGMLLAEWRLALHMLGIGTVDIRGLIGGLDALHQQFNALAHSPAAA
jgi:hypothetical protein